MSKGTKGGVLYINGWIVLQALLTLAMAGCVCIGEWCIEGCVCVCVYLCVCMCVYVGGVIYNVWAFWSMRCWDCSGSVCS